MYVCIQLNLFLEGLSGSSDLPVPIRNTVVLLTRTISGTTAATMKPLLSGPPIKRTPSIKRTLSQVSKLTSYIFLLTNPYSDADADTKINCIWLIFVVNNLYEADTGLN